MVTVDGEAVRLTQVEYRIVELIARQPGKVLTYSTIIATIWGRMDDGSVKKLQVNMANIRKKLGDSSRNALYIKTAYAEEPSFRDCKVIYTPSTQILTSPIPANMDGIIAFRNATISATQGLGEKKLVPMLNKLGTKYADGIGFIEENETLQNYAEGLGKPCMQPLATEDYGTHYPTFYDNVWSIGRPDEEDTK